MLTQFFWSALVSALSVVVPGITATRLFARSATVLTFAPSRVSKLPPSTKVRRLKSTVACRPKVLVVDPHSRSTVPFTTRGMRVSAVTGVHDVLSVARPSCSRTPSATRRHRSTE